MKHVRRIAMVGAWALAFVAAGASGVEPNLARSAAVMWLVALPLVILGSLLLLAEAD